VLVLVLVLVGMVLVIHVACVLRDCYLAVTALDLLAFVEFFDRCGCVYLRCVYV
jgi:hypothetical protein